MAGKKRKANKKPTQKQIPRKVARRELKKKAVEYKGGACEACGYDKCLASLTFHHRDPNEKDFNISQMIGKLEWSQIKKEIINCYLLCSNCHYEVHEGLLDGYIDDIS